jgi:hypothetical protein
MTLAKSLAHGAIVNISVETFSKLCLIDPSNEYG